MANFYLITYDPRRTDNIALHELIKVSNLYVTWWHYIHTVYIVKAKSNVYLSDIHSELLSKWPNQRFLIVKIDPTIRNGWLPPDAWEWFKRNT